MAADDAQLRGYEKGLVASVTGSYTAQHSDSYGLCGWMYLLAGRKEWCFYPPEARAALYDPLADELYDGRRAAQDPAYESRFPLARLVAGRALEGTMAADDLLLFPGGWVHGVATPESSLGVGGSILNGRGVVGAMRSWLADRSQGDAGPLDFKRLLLHRQGRLAASAVPRDRRDLARVDEALGLCAQWEAAHRS